MNENCKNCGNDGLVKLINSKRKALCTQCLKIHCDQGGGNFQLTGKGFPDTKDYFWRCFSLDAFTNRGAFVPLPV